jgi:hypothetical protein
LLPLLLCSAHALAQKSQRVFGFDAQQLSSWYHFHAVSQAPQPLGTVKPQRNTPSTVFVLINGNFGGTFNVSGIGAGTSASGNNYIDITTNRALSFSASSFGSMQLNGTPASTAGSIYYEMQLYAGTSTSVGAPLSALVSGTDSGFNGQAVTLASASIPPDNHVVLRLTRKVSLTLLAQGNKDYTASGTITVSIN